MFSKFGTRSSGGDFGRLVETMAVECQAGLGKQMGSSYEEPSEMGLLPALLSSHTGRVHVASDGRHSIIQIKITIW